MLFRSAAQAVLGLDDLVIGAAILGADRCLLKANATLAAWLGRSPEALIGARWEDLLLSIEPLFDQRRWNALDQGARVQFTCQARLHQPDAADQGRLQVTLAPLALPQAGRDGCVIAQVQQLSHAGPLVSADRSQDEDLAAAARYVTSLLPNGLESLWGIKVRSRYLPSQRLAGDCFDYFWITDSQLVIYLLDVSGHGMASALQAVSLHNLIRSRSLGDEVLVNPEILLETLNQMFPIERQSNYFTIWYGIYDVTTRELVYASGGHPPSLLLRSAAGGLLTAERLSTRCLGVGLMEGTRYYYNAVQVEPGDRLMLYSDGLFEFFDVNGKLWSYEALVDLICTQPEVSLDVYRLTDTLRGFSRHKEFDDDCSVVLVDFLDL